MQTMLKTNPTNSSISDIIERMINLEISVVQLTRENISLRTEVKKLNTYADDANEKMETLEKIFINMNKINISDVNT